MRLPPGVAPRSSALALSPAAITVTDRTCFSVLGLEWRALKPFLDEQGIAYTHVGRRPVVLVRDIVAALERGRREWTEADTESAIEAAMSGGRRKVSSGVGQ